MRRDRPAIPEDVKRFVRQRCRFGCVICGLPIYEYHHIVEFSLCNEHEASNLTLLCDLHHKEATNKLLPQSTIEEANRNPFNKVSGSSSPYGLHYSGDKMSVNIGGNEIVAAVQCGSIQCAAVSVDDIDLLKFRVDSSGHILLDAEFFDRNNFHAVHIVQNQLITKADNWDIQFEGRTLTVREGPRKPTLELEFIPPNEFRINRAILFCNGIGVKVSPDYVFVANSGQFLVGCVADGCPIGIQLGRNLRGYTAGFSFDSKKLQRFSMSDPSITRKAKAAMLELRKTLANHFPRSLNEEDLLDW